MLEPAQRTKLLDVIFSVPDDPHDRSDLIASFAGMMNKFDVTVRGDILARIAELPQPVARRLFSQGFGASLIHLHEDEQNVVFEAWHASLPPNALPADYADELYHRLPPLQSVRSAMIGPDTASVARERDAFVEHLCKCEASAFTSRLDGASAELASL